SPDNTSLPEWSCKVRPLPSSIKATFKGSRQSMKWQSLENSQASWRSAQRCPASSEPPGFWKSRNIASISLMMSALIRFHLNEVRDQNTRKLAHDDLLNEANGR